MPFLHPRVTAVSYSLEISTAGSHDVIIIETSLHLNRKHPAYDPHSVNRLILAAQAHLTASGNEGTHIRLISTHSGEI
ncbi:hypothetical protein JQ604_19165 [Bradyrhizobium jicamae]|nr:hypothetical protein [Bradyrhizobium jicamae]